MSTASPIPALADRVSTVRDEIAVRCSELFGVEVPAARSELMKLREALRLLSLAEDRMRACGPSAATRTVATPASAATRTPPACR